MCVCQCVCVSVCACMCVCVCRYQQLDIIIYFHFRKPSANLHNNHRLHAFFPDPHATTPERFEPQTRRKLAPVRDHTAATKRPHLSPTGTLLNSHRRDSEAGLRPFLSPDILLESLPLRTWRRIFWHASGFLVFLGDGSSEINTVWTQRQI